jgi:hypothetical protein
VLYKIESTLRELIKKFVPDRGFSMRDGQRVDYAERREELLEQASVLLITITTVPASLNTLA